MSGPPALGRLQADFARAVLEGDSSAIAGHLAGDAALAERRLAIYREAIAATRLGAMRAAFPVVARLVGEAFFGEAVRRFGERSPPDDGDLNRYGAGFASFLGDYPHARPMPWLADVASLEWAWHECLMAAEAPALDFAALAGVAEEAMPRLRLALHPCVRIVRSDWPVLALWEANQADRDGAPAREEGAEDVLVWREDGRVWLGPLSAPEADFLQAISRGVALEEAAGDAGEWDLAALLRRLAQHGLICGFSLPETPGP